jgi:flagellar biosynthesis anti-sigma factor FlgM
MRINDAYRQTPNAATTDAASATRPKATDGSTSRAESSQGSPPVTVTVSDKARELSTQSSDASAAKVASLQAAISGGTFKVNAALIASKIVNGE